jgi:hypothetical protein
MNRTKTTYCCECRYFKRGNTWELDICKATKKLCKVMRGGHKPVHECKRYKPLPQSNKQEIN